MPAWISWILTFIARVNRAYLCSDPWGSLGRVVCVPCGSPGLEFWQGPVLWIGRLQPAGTIIYVSRYPVITAAPVLQHETCCPCTCQASAVADKPTVHFDRCSISLIAKHLSKATLSACPCQLPLCRWHYEEFKGNCTWDQALRGGLSCPRCPSAGHCLLWLPPWLLPWPQQGLDAPRLSFHHLPAHMPAQYTPPNRPSCQGRMHGMATWQTFPATKIDAMQGIRAGRTRAQSALTYDLNEKAQDSQCFMRLMRVSFKMSMRTSMPSRVYSLAMPRSVSSDRPNSESI